MSKPPSKTPFWGRISFLWLMLTPIVCAIYTLLLPIAPNDFWYNVRAGAFIVENGKIPTTALFTTSLPAQTPYYYQSWIAQILFFKTLQLSNLSGIILLRAFCLTATFIILSFAAWRRLQKLNAVALYPLPPTTSARIVALSTLLAFMLAASNMDIRPQTFSVLLFAVFTFLVFEWPHATGKKRASIIGALTLLMVFWANTHGAFFVGLIILVAFLGGELLHFFLAHPMPKLIENFGLAFNSAALKSLITLAILCALAPICNPRGVEIYSYVFKLAGDKSSQRFIQEWRSPSFAEWYGALFFAALLLVFLLAGVLLLRSKISARNAKELSLGILGIRLGEGTVLATMAVLALRDIRSIIWFAIFMVPIITALCAQLLLRRLHHTTLENAPPKNIQVVNAIIALLLVFSCIPFLPAFKPQLGLPPEYSSHFAPNPIGQFPVGFSSDPPLLLDRDTPVEAVAYLKIHPPRGRLWNDMVFGSYLTWVGAPVLPHCDPRVEMYPLPFWEEYGRLIEGPPDAPNTLRKQGFTDALLHLKDEKPLIARLEKNGWRRILKKGNAILLRDIRNK